MANMTPSSITAGQIGKICDLLMVGLRKAGLLSKPVQQVIEAQGEQLVSELVAVVRNRVATVSNLIVRRVKVDRTQTPQRVLDATGRRQNTDSDVVTAMPRGDGEEVEVYFFKLDRYVNDAELKQEYKVRGLVAADPYSLAAANEADPAFADDHPNSIHWQDVSGRWCYVAFDRWHDERRLSVSRHARYWSDNWWFAGLRK